MENILIIIFGFLILLVGSNFLVNSAVALSDMIKIPKMAVGLVIIALGTSMPEAAVSVLGALEGNYHIALGTVIGSSIFNILLIVGICAFMKPVPSSKELIERDYPWLVSCIFVLLIILSNNYIGRLEGVVLMLMFITYMYMLTKDVTEQREKHSYKPELRITINLIIGTVMVIVGGRVVVASGADFARDMGIYQEVMGLTIMAIGASLPELVTAAISIRKKEFDLAVGNIVGSNIFNMSGIIGITSLITPMECKSSVIADIGVMLVATLIMYFFAWHKKRTSRTEGVVAMLLYVLFLVVTLTR